MTLATLTTFEKGLIVYAVLISGFTLVRMAQLSILWLVSRAGKK